MNKHIFILFIVLALSLNSIFAQEPWSGTGDSPDDPFLINSVSDLVALRNNVNNGTTYLGKYFRLTQDLDLGSISNFTPIGLVFVSFNGTFDGDGHTISNLKIIGNQSYMALFGYVRSAIIENLNLIGCVVTANGVNSIGGVCAFAQNSIIRNVTCDGAVTAGQFAGLICGTCVSSTIVNCVSKGTVNSNIAGGICGNSYGGSHINNCCNLANITGGFYLGGICGENGQGYSPYNYINNCINFGSINGSVSGGIVADAQNYSVVTNCINAKDGAGIISPVVGSGMGQVSRFANLFYDNQICTNINLNSNVLNDATVGKSTAELVSGHFFNDQENWLETPGCYPIPKGHENDAEVQLYSIAAVLSNGENLNSVKKPIWLSQVKGVTWSTSSVNYLKIFENCIAYPNRTTGNYKLTATLESYSKEITVKVKAKYNPAIVSQGNWNPSTSASVFIDGPVQLGNNSSYTVQDVYFTNDGSLTINPGKKLIVTGTISNYDSNNLIIDNGELIVPNDGVQATYLKEVVGFSLDSTANDGWQLIASPMANQLPTENVVSLTNGEFDLYRFVESIGLWDNVKDDSDFNIIDNGRGYLYANSANVSLAFSGGILPSNQIDTVSLSYNEESQVCGFNLVGNPFATSVSHIEGVNIADGIYMLNEAGNELVASPLGYFGLSPCQGFFVKALGPDAKVFFNASNTSKSENMTSSCLSITLKCADDVVDCAYLLGKGNGLDKLSLNEKNTNLYFSSGDDDYAIAIRDNANEMVTLSLRNAQDATYMFDIKLDNSDYHYLHLVDNLTGADIDLLEGCNSYVFEAKSTDNPSRFVLVYR